MVQGWVLLNSALSLVVKNTVENLCLWKSKIYKFSGFIILYYGQSWIFYFKSIGWKSGIKMNPCLWYLRSHQVYWLSKGSLLSPLGRLQSGLFLSISISSATKIYNEKKGAATFYLPIVPKERDWTINILVH